MAVLPPAAPPVSSRNAANRGFLINSGGVSGFNMKCGQQRQEELDKESANF
jgi:hypothetical protein